MNVERTMFWFKDGDEQLVFVNEDFFGLAISLNRLLNNEVILTFYFFEISLAQ